MTLLTRANWALILSFSATVIAIVMVVLRIGYPMPVSLFLLISCFAMLLSAAVRVVLVAATWLRRK